MPLFQRRQPEARSVSLAQLQKILDRSGITWSGVVVDGERAMRNSAVWASVELVATLAASMPIEQFRKAGDQSQPVPLDSFFIDPDPDPSVSIAGFVGQVLRSAAMRGNAYALLQADPVTGRVMRASTVHPDRVHWQIVDGKVRTLLDGERVERWPLGPLWHFALFQQPGSPIGLSPLEYHRQTIGATIAAQKFGAAFFDSGGNPSIIIQVPDEPTVEESKALKQKVLETTRGNREPLILPQELRIERVSVTPDDSQFLETQRYGVEEIARVFLGGFPELIGSAVTGSGSITYANREQRMADFIALSLGPRYLVPLERALSMLLPADQYVRFNIDSLLRADLAGRYASYKLAAEVSTLLGQPLLTVDEMRQLENLPLMVSDSDATASDPADIAATAEQARSLSVAETVQKVYLGVGKVLTSDEARAIINAAGGTLPVPGPQFPDAAPAAASLPAIDHQTGEMGTRVADGAPAVICDIDGTLLDDDDQPYSAVIDWVNTLQGELHVVSGRLEADEQRTRRALQSAGLRDFTLHLRPYAEKGTLLHKRIVADELLATLDVRLAIDNDSDARAVYQSLGIDTADPADIGDDDDSERSVVRAVELDLPQYMRDAAARGVALYEEGLGGDDLADETVRAARQMARGDISEAKVLLANAWQARHAVDLEASKNTDPDDPEWPGAGAVAHYLWAIDPTNPQPARDWFASKAADIQKDRESETP